MATQKTKPATLVSGNEIASALGIDIRRVQQLAAAKILPRAGHGKYDLRACIEAFDAYKAGQAGDDGEDSKADAKRKLKAEADLAEHKAELARLEVEEEQKRLIPAKEVADAIDAMLTELKAKLLAIPGLCVDEIYAAPDREVALQVLTDAVHDALTALSQRGAGGGGAPRAQ